MEVWLFPLILVILSAKFHVQVLGKFLIKNVKQCDSDAGYLININTTLHTVRSLQYLDANANLLIPLDNTLRLNVTVETLVGEKNHVHLFTMNEKKACDATHKILGEFMYEIERTAGVIPGMCPIPQGRYSLHNMALHFEKITVLHAFPFGKMRATTSLINPKNSAVCCLNSEVENHL